MKNTSLAIENIYKNDRQRIEKSIPEYIKYDDCHFSNIYDDSTLNGSDNDTSTSENFITSININVSNNEETKDIEAV